MNLITYKTKLINIWQIFIKVPNESQRIGILESLKTKTPELISMDSESVGRRTPGYVGADLIRLTHLAVLTAFVSVYLLSLFFKSRHIISKFANYNRIQFGSNPL